MKFTAILLIVLTQKDLLFYSINVSHRFHLSLSILPGVYVPTDWSHLNFNTKWMYHGGRGYMWYSDVLLSHPHSFILWKQMPVIDIYSMGIHVSKKKHQQKNQQNNNTTLNFIISTLLNNKIQNTNRFLKKLLVLKHPRGENQVRNDF